MREIKFKIWDKENKKFTDDDIYMDKNGNLGRVQDDGFYCEDTFIPLRFTGLLDKKGDDIYEGDILHNKYDKFNYEIMWDDNSACWSLGKDGQPLSKYKLNEFWDIIGNIYENSDLLNIEDETK